MGQNPGYKLSKSPVKPFLVVVFLRATQLVEAPSSKDIEETSEDIEEAELDEASDLMEAEDIDIDEDDPRRERMVSDR
jgi:hypothetical protein